MFGLRWNNYKDNSRKFDRGEDCLIDKTDPRATTKREDYWIHTLKTKAPIGLNVEGGY